MFQGGGNIPLLMPVMERLAARGHTVRILAGPGVRRSRLPVSADFLRRISRSGAALVPFREPDPHPFDSAPPPAGLFGSWAPRGFKGVAREATTAVWAPAWAVNVAEQLDTSPTDVVVADFVLLGALAAAEKTGVPSVVLMHTVPLQPLPGVPPYGPGWLPARGVLGRTRDTLGRAIVSYLHHRNALPPLNDARGRLGLGPLHSTFEQYDRAARALMLVNSAFDHPAERLPRNLRHVGTPIDDSGVSAWTSPWPPQDRRPLVIVSLSTLDQGQLPLLRRILLAVAALDEARVLVTVGPSLDPANLEAPPNARLERFIAHSAVLPQAAAMVTQCGLGTVTKALTNGVPLLCIPLVGDQPENAARIVARGAGIRIASDAPPDVIVAALRQLLRDLQFRQSASAVASAFLSEGEGTQRAVEEIEAVINTRSI
jgi:UDP:flavonoid glycosyltransferase YjiC (YdhE family)